MTQTELVSGGLLRISEACKFLGISVATIYRLMERGELTYTRVGYGRRIPKNAIEQYLVHRMVEGSIP